MPPEVAIATEPRGDGFSAKFQKGEWAEIVLMETLDRHPELFPVQYGISRGDSLETEEELDAVKEPGVGELKRPDILVYHEDILEQQGDAVRDILVEYNNTDPDERQDLLATIEKFEIPSKASAAIEAEASRFNLSERHGSSLNTFVKKEDRPRLSNWKTTFDVPILVCQLFYDCGYVTSFAQYEKYAEKRDDPNETTDPIPGIDHGIIPGVDKPGIFAEVENFPGSMKFGAFETDPQVVHTTGNGPDECEFDWDAGGKLKILEQAPFFYGGKFEESAVHSLASWCTKEMD